MARYTNEMRERALRMLAEAGGDHPNPTAAARHVAGLLGMSPETLRLWQRRAQVDAGERAGVRTEAAAQIKRLKNEVAQLRRANEILKAVSVFFAKELDHPTTR